MRAPAFALAGLAVTRNERVRAGDVLDRAFADQLDEPLAETERRRPGTGLIGGRGSHARTLSAPAGARRADLILAGGCAPGGRHPRRRVRAGRTSSSFGGCAPGGRYPRRRVRVDEHTIYLDESPVFYRSAGEQSGTPPLYLHGIPTSSDDWVDFLARTGGYAPDLIGFGRSGKGGHLDYSLPGLTGFLERFLAEVHVDKINVVAHDWGVAVGLTLAARHPERIERLVLMNAPPLFGGFNWPRFMRWWRTPWVGEGLMGSTTRGMLARTLRHESVNPTAWSDERIAKVWDQFDQGTQRAILRLVRSTNGEPPTPAPAPPTLIIWGDRDPWYPAALAGAYAARLPGATVERLSDAGHWPWLDRNDLVERVATFLEE
jgi:pimeloyl-ACP methyl ester carboxylesterase